MLSPALFSLSLFLSLSFFSVYSPPAFFFTHRPYTACHPALCLRAKPNPLYRTPHFFNLLTRSSLSLPAHASTTTTLKNSRRDHFCPILSRHRHPFSIPPLPNSPHHPHPPLPPPTLKPHLHIYHYLLETWCLPLFNWVIFFIFISIVIFLLCSHFFELPLDCTRFYFLEFARISNSYSFA